MVKMSVLLKNQLLEKIQESKGLTDKELFKEMAEKDNISVDVAVEIWTTFLYILAENRDKTYYEEGRNLPESKIPPLTSDIIDKTKVPNKSSKTKTYWS